MFGNLTICMYCLSSGGYVHPMNRFTESTREALRGALGQGLKGTEGDSYGSREVGRFWFIKSIKYKNEIRRGFRGYLSLLASTLCIPLFYGGFLRLSHITVSH